MRDPREWLATCDAADAEVISSVDGDRLAAAASDLAAKVLGRWYWPRFRESLAAIELTLDVSPPKVIERVMASEEFSQRVGEDETAVAFCAGVLDLLETSAGTARGLADVLARNYLIAVGLPRRSAGLSIDHQLEERLFPSGVVELPASEPGRGELALAHPLVAVELEHDPAATVASIHDCPPDGAPGARLLFLFTEDGAIEITDEPPLFEVLVTAGEAPCTRDTLVAQFDEEDRELVDEAIEHLVGHGLLARGETAG